jgi:hypothetical protein
MLGRSGVDDARIGTGDPQTWWMGRLCRRRVLVRSQGRERSMPNRWWAETCPKRHLRRQRDFKSSRNSEPLPRC